MLTHKMNANGMLRQGAVCNYVNKRTLYFPKCVTFLSVDSMVTQILFLDASFVKGKSGIP